MKIRSRVLLPIAAAALIFGAAPTLQASNNVDDGHADNVPVPSWDSNIGAWRPIPHAHCHDVTDRICFGDFHLICPAHPNNGIEQNNFDLAIKDGAVIDIDEVPCIDKRFNYEIAVYNRGHRIVDGDFLGPWDEKYEVVMEVFAPVLSDANLYDYRNTKTVAPYRLYGIEGELNCEDCFGGWLDDRVLEYDQDYSIRANTGRVGEVFKRVRFSTAPMVTLSDQRQNVRNALDDWLATREKGGKAATSSSDESFVVIWENDG